MNDMGINFLINKSVIATIFRLDHNDSPVVTDECRKAKAWVPGVCHQRPSRQNDAHQARQNDAHQALQK
jgi:hypothetical protein